jgi:hypothetical protein
MEVLQSRGVCIIEDCLSEAEVTRVKRQCDEAVAELMQKRMTRMTGGAGGAASVGGTSAAATAPVAAMSGAHGAASGHLESGPNSAPAASGNATTAAPAAATAAPAHDGHTMDFAEIVAGVGARLDCRPGRA